MKPIPKRLLIHSAELKNVNADNSWQEEETKTIANLKYVRIEPSSKLITAKDNRQVTLAATLLYDCRNSRPAGVEFIQGQKIIWNGAEHVIETIEPLYDGEKLHHYELGLI